MALPSVVPPGRLWGSRGSTAWQQQLPGFPRSASTRAAAGVWQGVQEALKLSATSVAGDGEECGLLVQVLKPADLKPTVIALPI